ncbi:MAG TPA: hypothetical protein VIT67_02505 [Povalibacter sp.]
MKRSHGYQSKSRADLRKSQQIGLSRGNDLLCRPIEDERHTLAHSYSADIVAVADDNSS